MDKSCMLDMEPASGVLGTATQQLPTTDPLGEVQEVWTVYRSLNLA